MSNIGDENSYVFTHSTSEVCHYSFSVSLFPVTTLILGPKGKGIFDNLIQDGTGGSQLIFT